MSWPPKQYRCSSILSSNFSPTATFHRPACGDEHGIHQPPEFLHGFLHCYYKDIDGTRPVTRELNNPLVWLCCGFEQPPSRDAVDRFLTNLEHVIDDIFDHLVKQTAYRSLLDSTFCIDSTDIEAIPWNEDASWNYDSQLENYYGFGCTMVSTEVKIPSAVEFTESKQTSEETAMRVTTDALAVAKPLWMIGDSDYDTLDWHGYLLGLRTTPVAPYNPLNFTDPLDIEYRVEDRIEKFSKKVHLKQSVLDEVYNRRTQVERTNDAVKDCDLGHVRARAQVFLALCLRLVAIINYERGDNSGREMLKV